LRQYSCAKKSSNLKCKYKKAWRKTFVQKRAALKMLVKLTPEENLKRLVGVLNGKSRYDLA
jgi:hypothetical protein